MSVTIINTILTLIECVLMAVAGLKIEDGSLIALIAVIYFIGVIQGVFIHG